jgi:NADPH:quinone reductase-like Zn-dependent oxidoreductase
VSAGGQGAEPEVPRAMRALRIHAPGGPESLVCEAAAVPAPAIGDVLLGVAAASFTPTELSWPSTWVDRAGRDRTPVIPGHEVCGTVVGLGWGTTGFEIGDSVYGLTDWYRDGAAADYVLVEARNLAPRPAALSEVEAAATAMPALTASEGLFTHGGLAAGQTVLVLGAGGGVGSFAVQLARDAGARVLAAARSSAREVVLRLGADELLDLDRDELELRGGAIDLVIDLVGGETLARSWPVVRAGGTVVSAVEDPNALPGRRDDARGAFFVVEPSGRTLRELEAKLDSGALRPIVGAVRPLERGGDAFAAKAAGRLPGKAVLRVED